MPNRTVHGVLADALGDVYADEFTLGVTTVLSEARRVATFDPADPDGAPLNPEYSATGAVYAPRPRTIWIMAGTTTFQLLESDDPDGMILYDFRLRGTNFPATTVRGVLCPNTTEHPDPLYLWQLVKDYSGRKFAQVDRGTVRPSDLRSSNTSQPNLAPKRDPAGDVFLWDTPGTGPQTFLELPDTPAAYAGEAGRVARVNVAETGVEFADAAGGLDEGEVDARVVAGTLAHARAGNTSPWGLSKGGTGASTVAAARTALAVLTQTEVDARIVNRVLARARTGNATAWGIAKGGTGATTAQAARVALGALSQGEINILAVAAALARYSAGEKTKLADIEANATRDQTGLEIVTALDAELGGSGWQTPGGGGGTILVDDASVVIGRAAVVLPGAIIPAGGLIEIIGVATGGTRAGSTVYVRVHSDVLLARNAAVGGNLAYGANSVNVPVSQNRTLFFSTVTGTGQLICGTQHTDNNGNYSFTVTHIA